MGSRIGDFGDTKITDTASCPSPQSSADSTSTSTTSTSTFITLFYANITKWGKRAETFLSNDSSHFVCFAEHHLDRSQFDALRPKFVAWKRSVYVAYAQKIGAHAYSTSGGLAIFPRSFLCCQDVDADLFASCVPENHRGAPRFTSCVLRTKSVSILLIIVYLRTSEGLSDANVEILHQIFMLASIFRGAVLIGGDWQFPPGELITSPWVKKLKLSVISPAGLEASCTSGSGRLIDYFLATEDIAPYIQISADFSTGFKPHIGFRVRFPARLRSYRVPTLRVPRSLPALPADMVLDSRALEFSEKKSQDIICKWAPHTGVLGCTQAMARAMSPVEMLNSQRHCFAATLIESYSATVGGVAPGDLQKFIGRGGFPHVSLQPIIHRQTLFSRYTCPAANLWSIIEAQLAWVKRASVAKTVSMNLRLAIIDLHRQIASISSCWTRQAAPNCPAKAWGEWIAGLSTDAVVNGDLGYSSDRVDVWISRAVAQKQRAISAKCNEVKKTFRTWLKDDLASGASAAHKMAACKEFVPPPDPWSADGAFQTCSDLWEGKDFRVSGADGVDLPHVSAAGPSGAVWTPWRVQLESYMASRGRHSPNASRRLEELRSELLGDPEFALPAISCDMFRSAARCYPARKARGADFWTSDNFRLLPDRVLQPLVSCLNGVQAILAWPLQSCLNLMGSIPKPLGGERWVAKTPLYYRLWNIVRSPFVKEWGVAHQAPFDHAVKGRSALLSGAHRCLANEIAAYSGQHVATVLWDIHKFFDCIRPIDVIREARRLNYPPADLVLAMLMHMAPRCLIYGCIVSYLILPTRSIIAGCFHSGFFARGVMDNPITRMSAVARPPALRVSTFVDDVAQVSVGNLRSVSKTAVFAALSFCSGMAAIKLSVSPKSAVLSTDPRVARLIVRLISKHAGVHVRSATGERDLGVWNSVSRSRKNCTVMQSKRLKKAAARFKKVAGLTRAVRAARKLAHTGALPAALWGSITIGVSPTSLSHLRSQFAAATGIAGRGRCATTAIAISAGPNGDPGITTVVDQLSLYIDLWRFDASLRAAAMRYWSSMRASVFSGETVSVWNRVSGPLSATVATLEDQGWDLQSQLRWRDPAGDEWIPSFDESAVDKSVILSVAAGFARQKLWERASAHWCGKGVEGGVDWRTSMALHRHISTLKAPCSISASQVDRDMELEALVDESTPEHWPDTALAWLELLLCGGYWPAQRFHDLHPEVPALCPRCRREPETALHLLWTCPANQYLDDSRVVSTQDLVQSAVDGAELWPCLWLRGLLPSRLVPVNTPHVDDELLWFVGRYPPGGWSSGVYFTDGSGGPYSSYPSIRRCGVGICVIDMNADFHNPDADPLIWGAYLALPGPLQTVPRSELYAVMVIVERASVGLFEVRSDAKIIVDLYARGRAACLSAEHSDLWRRIWSILDRGVVILRLVWVKGHSDEFAIAEQYMVEPVNVFGNTYADALADRAAEEHQVSLQDAITTRWHFSAVRNIQARAIVILMSTLQRRSSATMVPKVVALRAPTIAGLAVTSQHEFNVLGRVLHCCKCHGVSPSSASGRKQWLATSCRPDVARDSELSVGVTRPTRLQAGRSVRVGHVTLHASHTLCVFRGLFFCSSCGFNASVKAQKLVAQCSGPGSDGAGKRRAARLLAGKLPSGLSNWPANFVSKVTWVQLDD